MLKKLTIFQYLKLLIINIKTSHFKILILYNKIIV